MSNDTLAPRFVDIDPARYTPRQAEIVERIEAGPRGRLPINLRVWLHNPDFLDVVEPFGLYVSQLAPITKKQKEILVLVGACFWKAEYEWRVHQGHARKAGITQEQIAAIAAGTHPRFDDETDNLTYELVVALHRKSGVPQDVYERALAHFGHKGVSDLIGLIGLYTMISMTLNFYDVAAPASAAPTLDF